ncbi:DNA-directed RNA polymerase subunit beta' [Patescibacteria group bacterium]
MEPLGELKKLSEMHSLSVRLASPSDIRNWSRGEITKPETINYRTLKPEKDGLFDEKIFGPSKDWECYCGKYKGIRYKNVVCDKCGVEVTMSRVRRERMGHINLASPVVHVWYFKGAPSKLSLVLGVPPRAIDQVIYFARYLVLEVDKKAKKQAQAKLQKARAEREKEINAVFEERNNALSEKLAISKSKTVERIKEKEQQNLAVEELELDHRKKEAALLEEKKNTLDKTNELFNNLLSIVKSLMPLSIITEEEYDQLIIHEASNFFTVKMGAEAILEALGKVNLEKLTVQLREEITETKNASPRYVKVAKRLKVIDGMRRAKIDPTWIIMKAIPVLPPDLRPMVQLSGGRFATSDLNDLYRRVINRNNRLKHLIGLGAPEIILRNEKRMLQESVDSLIDASQRKATRRGRGRQPLRSLSDMLKGKQGRFRQNLLGKRVDYSGRSVIIPGPELGLNQCGLPKDMALEMFKPFVLREMIAKGIAPNVKSAKNMLDGKPPEVFDILEDITKDHPVLLNRAPTLHKLSIQAFYPILIEGSAIRVHPAICSGFNADFDGDQMAVHVPLSQKAIKEAKELMLPQNNLLRPSDGSPVSTPASKEMALGVYYYTSVDPKMEVNETIFSDTSEATTVFQAGKIDLRERINVMIDGKVIETTAGRILFNEALPENFEFINESASSSVIKDVFSKAFKEVSTEELVDMIDKVKRIGFVGGTLSGLSFGIFDAKVLKDKDKYIDEANKKIEEIEGNYNLGLITEDERRRLSHDVWIEVTEDLADKTFNLLDETNSIRVAVDAKVGRVSREQVKQLSAIRGLVVDPLGNIVELPVKSNFRQGLEPFEYVISGRGSRKGLTDTALKTADAGYLTRRLVDVAHDVLVREEDCGTKDGISIVKSDRTKVFPARILGRYAANVVKGARGKIIAKKNGALTEEVVQKIVEADVEEVVVRSALTCQSRYGVCVKCYGWDVARRKDVEIGTPAGVVAAQSIGEPGTQLTLRTKHKAGVLGLDVTQGLPRVEELVEARTPKVMAPLSEISGKVSVEEMEDGFKVTIKPTSSKDGEEREYVIPKTLQLVVKDKDLVDAGTPLAHGSYDLKQILNIKGLREAQQYIVKEIQAVYESQGIPINDKHFEVIVRKMSDEVKVVTSGDTPLLPGELIDKSRFEEENEKVLAAGGEPATAKQIVLGITKRSLFTESWLSAASFQQTTDVLTTASILGKEDRLIGLKENVIIGRLIPVAPETASLPSSK